jgi:3'-phosphoadenosine 5'-phosphosulfate sulfotransferase (PAPS reductase)/FAD synthetase
VYTHSEVIEKIRSTQYPVLVAFSGGKDSIAMVLYLLELGIDKDRIHLHHHDVDGGAERTFDWACTKSYVKRFADEIGLKLFFSYRKGGIQRAIYRNNEPKQDVYFQLSPGGKYQIAPSNKKKLNTRLKFPAIAGDLRTRWCSPEVKIDVFRTVVSNHPLYKKSKFFVLTGERRLESEKRKHYDEVERDVHLNTKSRKVLSWKPVIDWSEQMVWDIIERWKIQPHPAYMLGWSRCSCMICIFNSANIWSNIYDIDPKRVDKIGETEIDIGFTLHNNQNIYDYVASGESWALDPYWVTQATGEFTAPLFVDKWVRPLGAFKKERAGAL